MAEFDSYLPHLTYVGSQLTRRWEDPRSYPFVPALDVHKLTLSDWRVISDGLKSKYQGSWFEAYKLKCGRNFSVLAENAAHHFSELNAAGGVTLFFNDPFFPKGLREIKDPPFAINVLGSSDVFHNTSMIGVIGSRRASPFAISQSFELGKHLQLSGACTVSGGAFGCDIAAHHGVLSTCVKPCRAVVVLAGGLKVFYPRTNAHVFDEIIEHGGAVISEKLWSAPSKAFDFPIRNRIIAGICERVLVMQAGVKSGAMITANRALDCGRDVYVLNGPIGSDAFDGNQKLLLDGAIGFSGVDGYSQGDFFGWRSVGLDL